MGTRTQILVRGTVQGVGFRPFVYSLALERSLKGQVLNNSSGVIIDVEGDDTAIVQFIDDLRSKSPPLSIIDSVESKTLQNSATYRDFQIVESIGNGSKVLPISADIATCNDCLAEMFDPENRRYRYPFINCTNCGPRFTIIENIPYDRENTTMREFEMCVDCLAEYRDPLDRRFHAEPTCCVKCGPQILLIDAENFGRGDSEKGGNTTGEECADDVIETAIGLLKDGEILAVKGIGGFHLVCDALNKTAVETLRKRKYREDKPFALMVSSVNKVANYCGLSEEEKRVLQSPERPIVLLDRSDRVSALAESVAPGMKTLGFMLPYTPLHHLLMENVDGPLVMTSGNISDEPICYSDPDAGERLKNIADFYLTNNRKIHIRMDDSVVRVDSLLPPRSSDAEKRYGQSKIENPKSKIILRRSRGFAPAPLKTSIKFPKQILACGAELKNTFCLTRDNFAFISHHIGDLENLETLRSFTEGIEHYKTLFGLKPEIIAYDLHPEYLSTKFAHSCDDVETKIGVQHHHAHIASCMADNGIDGEVIGVAMDGLGFGTDGKMWGGEFFVADLTNAERIAHLDYVPMPGGARAIREPWRMAATYLHKTFGDDFVDLDIPFVRGLDRSRWNTIASMIGTGTNCPETSSMGRLFDAVSGLLGLRSTINYEGQAAIMLEAVASKNESHGYKFVVGQNGIIDAKAIFKFAVDDLLNGATASAVSARFHMAVADLIADVAINTRDESKLNRVALSGGVFQNRLLLQSACELLQNKGFDVFTHSRVPTNDGGISLGQAVIANARVRSGSI